MKNEVKIDMRDIQKYIDGYIEYQNLINWIFDNDFRCELHDSNNADKSFMYTYNAEYKDVAPYIVTMLKEWKDPSLRRDKKINEILK